MPRKNLLSEAVRDALVYYRECTDVKNAVTARKFGKTPQHINVVRKTDWYNERKARIKEDAAAISLSDLEPLFTGQLEGMINIEMIRSYHEIGVSDQSLANAFAIDVEHIYDLLDAKVDEAPYCEDTEPPETERIDIPF